MRLDACQYLQSLSGVDEQMGGPQQERCPHTRTPGAAFRLMRLLLVDRSMEKSPMRRFRQRFVGGELPCDEIALVEHRPPHADAGGRSGSYPTMTRNVSVWTAVSTPKIESIRAAIPSCSRARARRMCSVPT